MAAESEESDKPVCTPQIRQLLEIGKQERDQRHRAIPKIERRDCALCLTEKGDITVRWFTLPCGHSFCVNCICEFFDIHKKEPFQFIRLCTIFQTLKKCCKLEKKCPLCRNRFKFDDLLIDEDPRDVKKYSEGITFKVLLEPDDDCIDSIYVLKEESTITILLLFFFKIYVPIRCGYRLNTIVIVYTNMFGEIDGKTFLTYPYVSLREEDLIAEYEYNLQIEVEERN